MPDITTQLDYRAGENAAIIAADTERAIWATTG
jgi:hypothetical protein